MNIADKKNYFEYFVFELVEAYKKEFQLDSNEEFNKRNDFSKLKVLKLLFFASSSSSPMLTIFNNFHAMPNGHVESDIYDLIKENSFTFFRFADYSLTLDPEFPDRFNLNSSEKESVIKKSVEKLKTHPQGLLTMSAMDLVELSHHYRSWKIAFNIGRSKGKYSEKIPLEVLEREPKICEV